MGKAIATRSRARSRFYGASILHNHGSETGGDVSRGVSLVGPLPRRLITTANTRFATSKPPYAIARPKSSVIRTLSVASALSLFQESQTESHRNARSRRGAIESRPILRLPLTRKTPAPNLRIRNYEKAGCGARWSAPLTRVTLTAEDD